MTAVKNRLIFTFPPNPLLEKGGLVAKSLCSEVREQRVCKADAPQPLWSMADADALLGL